MKRGSCGGNGCVRSSWCNAEVVCSRGSPYRVSAVQSSEYLAHDFLFRLDKEDGDQSRATAMSDREMIAFCPPNNRECC